MPVTTRGALMGARCRSGSRFVETVDSPELSVVQVFAVLLSLETYLISRKGRHNTAIQACEGT